MTAQQGMVTADIGKQWMLAFSALALGNTFPLLPFRLVDPGATAHAQLFSAGGMTDAIVSSIGFIVLIITPFPLWRRLAAVPRGRRLKPVMMAARIVGPICWILLGISSSLGYAEGLMERILVTVCVLWMGALAVTLLSVSRHRRGIQGDRAHSRDVVSAKRGCADGET